MKKITLLLCVIGIIISCKTNKLVAKKTLVEKEVNYIPYYLKVYEADSLAIIGNYDKSYKILDSLFKIYEPININSYYEVGTYLLSAYMTNHINILNQKVKDYYMKFGEIHIPCNKDLKYRKEFLSISKVSKAEIDSLKSIYFKNVNYKLRNQIVQMMERDQYYRTKEYNDLKMDSVSKVQYIEVKEIFQKNGYPSQNVVGYDGFFNIDKPATIQAILMHLSSENKFEILPVLLSFVKKGTCSPDVYASVYDKNIWILQDKQYYGTFLNSIGNNNLELLDSKNINSIRKSIGLPSLYYNQWREKFLY